MSKEIKLETLDDGNEILEFSSGSSIPTDEIGTKIEQLSGSEDLVEYDDPDEYVEGEDVETKYKVERKKQGLLNVATDDLQTSDERAPSTPWEFIVQLAKELSVEINETPKSGCRKCYGRGWVGMDVVSKNPVVCHCVFPVKTPNEKQLEMRSEAMKKVAFSNMSRTERRNVASKNKKVLRAMAKETFGNKEEETPDVVE